MYFKITLSILSRAEERIVESQDIFGHLNRSCYWVKKLLNVLAITSFLEEFLPFSGAIC